MSLVTRHLEIRARVRPSPEPPFDRLYDPLVDDLVRGGPFSCQRFETLWSDGPALRRLAELKRSPLAPELARELLDYHRRLGAAPASLASLELLARGEAVCAVAGQQPAPLGGPLYSLHKTASAVGLSARVTQRTGVPCVPVFWMHGEDSDFAEIRSATLADASLVLHEVTLPSAIHPDGGLLGALPLQPLADLSLQALRHCDSLAFHSEAAALVQSAWARARDEG